MSKVLNPHEEKLAKIEEQLAELKTARENFKAYKETANAALEAFKSSDDVFTFNHEHSSALIPVIADLEESIRTLGILAYAESGDKHPHEKVDIKIFTEAEVTDPTKAREWAFENLPAALKLDEAKVKKYAKDFGEVPGVEIKTEPRAQIATQL